MWRGLVRVCHCNGSPSLYDIERHRCWKCGCSRSRAPKMQRIKKHLHEPCSQSMRARRCADSQPKTEKNRQLWSNYHRQKSSDCRRNLQKCAPWWRTPQTALTRPLHHSVTVTQRNRKTVVYRTPECVAGCQPLRLMPWNDAARLSAAARTCNSAALNA